MGKMKYQFTRKAYRFLRYGLIAVVNVKVPTSGKGG